MTVDVAKTVSQIEHQLGFLTETHFGNFGRGDFGLHWICLGSADTHFIVGIEEEVIDVEVVVSSYERCPLESKLCASFDDLRLDDG